MLVALLFRARMKGPRMAAKHCSTCDLDWPTSHNTCLECGGAVWYGTGLTPMPDSEVASRRNRIEFEKHYEHRERELSRDPGWVPPEFDERLDRRLVMPGGVIVDLDAELPDAA